MCTQKGNASLMGERRGVYRVVVGKPEGKRPLGRPRHRWILGWIFRKWDVGGMDWMELTRDMDIW